MDICTKEETMNKEEWLINEVDKWQADNIIDAEAGDKIKKQYELYKSFNFNIFTILFSILGAVLIVSGLGLLIFNKWAEIPSWGKLTVAFLPLVISYIISIFSLITKIESKIWKEASALFNTISMFLALAIIVTGFHFNISFSQYLLIASLTTLPVAYIMNAVSPLIIYYTAILMWGSLNITFTSAFILVGLFILGTGLIFLNIKRLTKRFLYNIWLCILLAFPLMILVTKMLNGDLILGTLLYSTILFAARGLKIKYARAFKLVATTISTVLIILLTLKKVWIPIQDFGAISLGILTAVSLLASLTLEVFNQNENNYEFSYLLMLMALAIVRYVWGCLHLEGIMFEIIFMMIGIIAAITLTVGYVALGKRNKELVTSSLGFAIAGIIILLKVLDDTLFFAWKAVGFLIIGSIFLVVTIFLPNENKEVETVEEGGKKDEKDNTDK